MTAQKISKERREAIRVQKMYDRIAANEKIMLQKKQRRENAKAARALGVKKNAKSEWHNKVARICSLIGFFLVWQGVCMLNSNGAFFNPTFLPSPADVVMTGYKYIQDGTLWVQIWSSMYRTLLGFALGVVVALILGILTTSFQTMDNIISPILNMIGPIPVFAFLPMFIIWFGIGEQSKIILIAYATFLPLMTYTVDGINNTSPVLIRSAKSLGANQFQIFTKVIMKSALPNVFVGMKVSLALTFSALVVAEMMGASRGLGFMITNARNWFKVGDMFLAAALIGLEYTVFFSILTALEKLLFKWKRSGLSNAVET